MITYSSITNPGSREINEDSYKIIQKDNKICFIVADGLGGHDRGEVASGLVTNIFEYCFKNDYVNANPEFIKETFIRIQNTIQKQQKSANTKKMMSTGVALIIDNGVFWGNVGDSRLYCFKKNKVKCRTKDHSIPEMLVISGKLKEKDMRHHPDRNKLLSALGCSVESFKCNISDIEDINKYDAFLLCTDGFWELVDEKDMCKCLKNSSDVKDWIIKMQEIVFQNGDPEKMDNLTAIAVEIE